MQMEALWIERGSKAAISLREFAHRMERQLSQSSHPHTISERICHRGYGGGLRR